MAIVGMIPTKELIYAILLSDVEKFTPEGSSITYGVFEDYTRLYDQLGCLGDPEGVIGKALDELEEEGLVSFEDDNVCILGEFKGKKLYTYSATVPIFTQSKERLYTELSNFGKNGSAKSAMRARFLKSELDKMLDTDISRWTQPMFNILHATLYEIYTGGEEYQMRNSVEQYQVKNILKAYDKPTTFSILVNGVLGWSGKGVPTLTKVAVNKDEIFKTLYKKASADKPKSAIHEDNDDSEF